MDKRNPKKKVRHPPQLTETFDDFMMSKSKASPLQVAGLLLMGVPLLIGIVATFLYVWKDVGPPRGIGDFLVLVVMSSIFIAIGYLGFLFVRRAFRGRLPRQP